MDPTANFASKRSAHAFHYAMDRCDIEDTQFHLESMMLTGNITNWDSAGGAEQWSTDILKPILHQKYDHDKR